MYVIGETGILEELDLKGISHLGGPLDADKRVTLKSGEFMEHDHNVSGAGKRRRGGAGSYCTSNTGEGGPLWLDGSGRAAVFVRHVLSL